MKKTLLIFFTCLSMSCFAQFSKTHYIPPLSSSTNFSAQPQNQYLYISTPSETPVNVKINTIGDGTIELIVSKDIPVEYNIGFGTNSQLHVDPSLLNTPLTNKGFIIEADNLIYVAARVLAGSYNQAGSLVSKGISALGSEFRVGAFVNTATTNNGSFRYTFLSVLATEDGTVVDFSDIKTGVTLVGNTAVGNTPPSVVLNRGQSYVLATEDNSIANKDGLIGALVKSNKPVVVNCGSYGGTNGNNNNNLDLGFDQIVSAKNIGNEYIFVRGFGLDITERPLIVVHENNTDIYLNGSTTPYNATPLNAGQYITFDGTNYSAYGSLYVRTTKNVFAYQSVGGVGTNGLQSQANQEMFFVPPLNCSTPNIVDNIPYIDRIGPILFNNRSGLNIVTERGATMEISINGVRQPVGVAPQDILGKPDFVTYTRTGLTGDIGVFSSKQVYVSFFGSSGAATYGGYYSGFDLKPEITFNSVLSTDTGCIPNIELSITSDPLNNRFQWVHNGQDIPGAISNTYTPSLSEKGPGYYQVKKTIISCGTTTPSDEIPVSDCPINTDADGVSNNIDIDNDNDGITNCTESYGDKAIAASSSTGIVAIGNYSNSYISSTIPLGTGINTFSGNADDSFTTNLAAGKTNAIIYKLDFNSPISLGLKYNALGSATISSLSNEEFVIKSDIDKTLTVLNPSNQLLIDTNYDGIYESGVTEYSSFDIRFRLNGTVLLPSSGPPPAVDFKFQTYLSKSISFTHKNLSDSDINSVSFSFYAVCVPRDSDGDGITDDLDLDTDNDGILDSIEAQGLNTFIPYSTVDVNKDGLSDAFGTGLNPVDSDSDTIKDYLDLDSDNDGIYDLVESGSTAADTNLDGIIDGANFGANGLSNSVETTPESGILNYDIRDTDSDGIKNYLELDSDNDLCNDVIEAGFLDPNNDGILGNIAPPTVNTNGKVTSGIGGYTVPSSNYITAAPIVITSQPNVSPTCELQNATIIVADNGGNTYQWELSTNGSTWTPITNNATYSQETTNTLLITSVKNAMNGYKYRVQLNKVGNSCGLLSNETTLTVYPLPVVNPVTIVQCDDDSDGFSNFNLTVKNNTISSDPTAQFSYYISFSGAENSEPNKLINNPLSFKNTTAGSMSVWARTENSNGCFSVSQVNLVVSTTQIPPSYNMTFEICDDLGTANDDTDGIATFDFSSVTTDILRILPDPNTAYSIKYYKNEQDALSENDEILNTTNYRNEGYRDEQRIWVRVESTADNACYGLSPRILLKVNPKPNIDTNEDQQDDELVCSNLPSFFVRLDSGIQDGSPESDYTYQWTKDNMSLTSETMSFLEVNAVGTYSVKVNSAFGCSRTRTIKVAASDVAAIQSIDIIDLADTNTVTVNVTGQGKYEYSFDEPNGPFQLSNFFDNVTAGIHEVYINDSNGCGTVSKTIAILGAPKFFTPNGDGYNDYWNLKGANKDFNSKSIIFIFDRYGKLLSKINPSDRGWDGTFNGLTLPSDDYWFTIKLEDDREIKGHFSLKR
jgi:gliding motility-associated-like protein